MGNRRFEMHEYRHILARMRLGESDRQLVKNGLIGRNKAAEFRKTALQHGWLDSSSPLPDDQELNRVLSAPKTKQQPSTIEPFAKEVKN